MSITKISPSVVDFDAGITISTTDNNNNLVLTSTDADANFGPRLKLYRNSASAADGDAIGYINFTGTNDAGTPEEVGYAALDARIVDASDGTEDGRLEIVTLLAGVEGTSRILMDATETVFNDNSKDLDFRVESDANANAFFVDAGGGMVGFNTNTPTSNGGWTGFIHLAHTTNNAIVLDGTDSQQAGIGAVDGLYIDVAGHTTASNNNIIFRTQSANSNVNGVERMRINSSGTVSVGRTESAGATDHGIDLYGNGILYLFSAQSGNDDTFRSYNSSGTLKASIEADGDYIDHSDENYKENITDASSVLSTISDIKIRSFNWKDSGRKQSYGFVAQELKDVVPEATKVAEKEGDMWGVKNSRIVPMLTKAIQEQQELIETLEAKVKALEEA